MNDKSVDWTAVPNGKRARTSSFSDAAIDRVRHTLNNLAHP